MLTMSRSERIYQFIVSYKTSNDGNSPTFREIASGCQIASTSLVGYYLAQLVDQGRIRMAEDRFSRKIMVAGGRWRLNGEAVSSS